MFIHRHDRFQRHHVPLSPERDGGRAFRDAQGSGYPRYYPLIVVALALLLGYWAGLRMEIARAYDRVTDAWADSVRFDEMLPSSALDFITAALKQDPTIPAVSLEALRKSAVSIDTYATLPPDTFKRWDTMGQYDAAQMLLQRRFSEATAVAYGSPVFSSWGGLSTLQSKIEGLQWAVQGKHRDYNIAVAEYDRVASRWPERWMLHVMSWPNARELGLFSTFSGGQIKDPSENMGNDGGCAHRAADGDCE